MADKDALPLNLDRAFPLWKRHTASEVGLVIELLTMIWKAPDRRIHAPIDWFTALYRRRKCEGHEGKQPDRVLLCGAFWWSERDGYLYSPYIHELIGSPTKRTPIPGWMKKEAIANARRADWTGGTFREILACTYCECEIVGSYHFDHALPLARGGINHPMNLRLSCPTCNFVKGATTEQEYMARLREQGAAPE